MHPQVNSKVKEITQHHFIFITHLYRVQTFVLYVHNVQYVMHLAVKHRQLDQGTYHYAKKETHFISNLLNMGLETKYIDVLLQKK